MWLDRLAGKGLIGLARLITGARAFWTGCGPAPTQRLYYANHASHLDFLLLWAMLPPAIRYRTRPVAGADYWGSSAIKRYLIHRVFNGVLVERGSSKGGNNPLAPLYAAIAQGDSLIFFPEGTRSTTNEMLPFKAGLYHLAREFPQLDLVPVLIENLNRVMPKGHLLPVPLICVLHFGAPCHVHESEEKSVFLQRAQENLRALAAREPS